MAASVVWSQLSLAHYKQRLNKVIICGIAAIGLHCHLCRDLFVIQSL